MIKFEKPQYKVTEYVESNNYGKFELEPLERGFGTTLGNALRRVMLSSLPGSAITSVKIDGVMHEFQTIDGIMEDVTSIILNLKNVVVKNHTEEDQVITLVTDKEGVVTAGDISCPADVEIINRYNSLKSQEERLSKFLLENDFSRGKVDTTLFIKRKDKEILVIQIYIDDIIFGSTNEDLC